MSIYFNRTEEMWKIPKRFSAMQMIVVAFLIIILVGALLLTLPISSRSHTSCGFLTALFTATSATCVTGLILADSYVQWSGFGQLVLLGLIEIGGLGFMSAATIVIFLLRKRIGLRERILIAQALNVNEFNGVVRLQKTVLRGSFAMQGLGALLLFLRFMPQYGFYRSFKWGIFHSISAFCNAGFDIFGELEPGAGLILFQKDPIVLLVLSALIIVGGLGFLVWQEVWEHRRFKKCSVYARLVLSTTAALLISGTVSFCLLEWDNPGTLGGMSVPVKLLNAFFQSVTLRTAGFSSIDQGSLTEGGKAASLVLMLIGGSSGSTAGGLKTVTFVVMLLLLWSRMRGRSTVCAFHRTIPDKQTLDALILGMIMVVLGYFGGVFISASGTMPFTDALYEAVSALGTVGLSSGGTAALTIPGRIMIIIYMFFGRVGILTISLGFLMGNRAAERFRYAETSLLIG